MNCCVLGGEKGRKCSEATILEAILVDDNNNNNNNNNTLFEYIYAYIFDKVDHKVIPIKGPLTEI